jgi:O-antigen/teichoic acid export membrane protein
MNLAVFAKEAIYGAAASSKPVAGAPAHPQVTYFGEIAWVAIAQGAAFLGGLAVVKMAATVLGPAEYGKLSVALAIIGIAQVCFYGAISQTAMRFLAFASAHNLLRDYKISLVKLAGIAAALVLSVWIVASLFGWQRLAPVPAAILVACAIGSGAQMIAMAVCNAARKREVVGIAQVAESLIRPVLIFIVTYLTIASAYHTLVAYLISTCLVASIIVALWSVKAGNVQSSEWDMRNGGDVSSGHLTWTMTTFAAPFVIFAILGVLGSHGERLLLAKWATWPEVGRYSVMAQLVMAPNVLFTAVINQFYFPLVLEFRREA